MEYRGTVERKRLFAGTKSEHHGLVLVTEAGTYKLRRQGGNAFQDPELATLAGKTILCDGILRDNVLLMTRYEVVA